MLKVGDVVRITRNWPWGSELREGDLAFVVSLKVASLAVAEVNHNGKTWWIDPTPGIHAELVQAAPAAPVTESAQADAVGHGRPVEGTPVLWGGEDVKLDRDKAEKLCQLYELYRKAHDHATAFELAYGIEVEGLPF